jgi:DNA-binding PadR family transcriptional regulator
MKKTLTKQEEQILLAVYSLGDNAYLIPIREKIKEFTGKYFSVGTIYAPLNRLNDLGLLDSFQGESNAMRGGKAKKYYRVTERGFDALREARELQQKMWGGLTLPESLEEKLK